MITKIFIAGVVVLAFIFAGGYFFHDRAPEIKTAEQAQDEVQDKETASCDPLVFDSPVDLSKATSILWPGQVRGGDFKRHGGFRFDTSANDEIVVRAPMDAVFVEGSRYIEVGEVQYMFDFQTDCGLRYRFDHLLVLAPKFAAAVQDLPEAKVNDSRTSRIRKKIHVKKGEVIATAVGVKDNVFVDFGVYKTAKLFQGPISNPICGFELLPEADIARIKSLAATASAADKQTGYCDF